MEIDRIGVPDFNPGWLSRLALPWQGELQRMAVASLAPLSISQREPLTTLADWPGILTSNVMPGESPQDVFRRLQRWMPVTLPAPGSASRTSAGLSVPPFDYHSPQRPRRGMASPLGMELPEENVAGEQETTKVGDLYSDLTPPSRAIEEHEPEWTDLASPLIRSNAFAPVLDYQALAHLQPNSVWRDLAIAVADLPVALPTLVEDNRTDHTEPSDGAVALRSDNEMEREPTLLYRAAEARRDGSRNPASAPLSRNLANMQRAAVPEYSGAAGPFSVSASADLVPSSLTRVVSDQLPVAGSIVDELRTLPILRGLQGDDGDDRGEASSTEAAGSRTIAADFTPLRSTLVDAFNPSRYSESGITQTDAFQPNALEAEPAGGSPQPEKSGLEAASEDRFEGVPALTFLRPLRSAVSLDTRILGSALPPSLTLPLRRAAQSLAPLEPLATLSGQIANFESSPILPNPVDLVRSAPAAIGASAFAWHRQTDRVIATGEPNPPRETNRVQGFETAPDARLTAAPQVTYPVEPLAPTMQVRRAVSEVGPRGSLNESVTNPALFGEPPAPTVGTPSGISQTNEAEPEPPSANDVSGGPRGYPPAPVPAPPDVNAIARQVYAILKDRLRAERERHDLYGR